MVSFIASLITAVTANVTSLPRALGRRALVAAMLGGLFHSPALAEGPLRIHPANPRYFTDSSGRAIYLAGSHTWTNVQDIHGWASPFDFEGYLDFLQKHNHNFTRLWVWESPVWVRPDSRIFRLEPQIYRRTGPGIAFGGWPAFDLSTFDESYFARLRDRVLAARKRKIYVGVMLFQGFSVSRKEKMRMATPWLGHPFRKGNNINGIDGDTDADSEGRELHRLGNPAVLRLQEAYVRKVVASLNDLDNVIYEISNESDAGSTEWQYHMIRYIREQESQLPKQHPVWMSFQWDGITGAGADADLFQSPADAVSPRGPKWEYRDNPPLADGAKVVIPDTDHLWGIGGDRAWVWKSFLRGMHPVFMDPYEGCSLCPQEEPGLAPRWQPVRRAMGDTVRMASRLDLAVMLPTDDPRACSTRYCLRDPGKTYLVYQPALEAFQLEVEAGRYAVEWIKGSTGESVPAGAASLAAGSQTFLAPFDGDAVLLLRRVP